MTLLQRLSEIINKRYPQYRTYAAGERVLLAMSVLANDIKVREATGRNDGAYVQEILSHVNLGKGYPWCAAAIEFASDFADSSVGPDDRKSARVMSWYNYAKATNRHRSKPSRGMLCMMLNEDGTGHMGIVAAVLPWMVVTYEGNTSSGVSGSQRDGDGVYRRTRSTSFWNAGFVNIDYIPSN